VTGTATATGCLITQRENLSQNILSPDLISLTENRLTRVPSVASRAGISVNATRSENKITVMPPMPKDRSIMNWKNSRPDSPIIDVTAENTIALPAVARCFEPLQ
jgi:hypothetical protein